jgi:hypothetical protein
MEICCYSFTVINTDRLCRVYIKLGNSESITVFALEKAKGKIVDCFYKGELFSLIAYGNDGRVEYTIHINPNKLSFVKVE